MFLFSPSVKLKWGIHGESMENLFNSVENLWATPTMWGIHQQRGTWPKNIGVWQIQPFACHVLFFPQQSKSTRVNMGMLKDCSLLNPHPWWLAPGWRQPMWKSQPKRSHGMPIVDVESCTTCIYTYYWIAKLNTHVDYRFSLYTTELIYIYICIYIYIWYISMYGFSIYIYR